jgi:hypothetical protein
MHGDETQDAADGCEDFGESHTAGGTAASSRIWKYRRIPSHVTGPRNLRGLLQWAAVHGVTEPPYAEVRPVPFLVPMYGHDPRAGNRVLGQYFSFRFLSPDEIIYWEPQLDVRAKSLVDRQSGKVVIMLREGLLNNAEAFLHHLAHEIHELEALHWLFTAAGGGLSARRIHQLTSPRRDVRNLHFEAWEWADTLIERLRRETQ